MHRRDLRDAVKGTKPPVRLLALNWSLDLPLAEIHRICADRILARGANHQTLHGDEHSKAHESVIWQFLHTTEPLADDEADTVIEMDVREDLEHALSRAVDAVVRVLELPRPDAERVGAALAKARGYRPERTDAQTRSSSGNPPRLRDTSAFQPRSTSSTRWTPTLPHAAKTTPCAISGTRSRRARASRAARTLRSYTASNSQIAWICGSAAPGCTRSPRHRCSPRASGTSSLMGALWRRRSRICVWMTPRRTRRRRGLRLYRSLIMRCARACMSRLERGARMCFRLRRERWSRHLRRARRVCIVCRWKMCISGGGSRVSLAEAGQKKGSRSHHAL
jgi:hypothetical protein